MRCVAFVAITLVSGCSQAGSIYDRPIPDRADAEALFEIRDGIRPEDQEEWQFVATRLLSPVAKPVAAKTVGQAIERVKARKACMAEHDVTKVLEPELPIDDPKYAEKTAQHVQAYNQQVAAYNACLELPI